MVLPVKPRIEPVAKLTIAPPPPLLSLDDDAMRALRGSRLAMIFQEPMTSLNPVLTVGMQIVEVIEAHTPLRGKAARARAIEWLQRVGIPEPERRIDTYPFQMSGGQKQRVMIAMTLACEPDSLIADEPTTALDVTVQAQILKLLKELQSQLGMAMLFITHDLGIVRKIADDVAVMQKGRLRTEPARVQLIVHDPIPAPVLTSPGVHDAKALAVRVREIVAATVEARQAAL